jgi:hypothetical protein
MEVRVGVQELAADGVASYCLSVAPKAACIMLHSKGVQHKQVKGRVDPRQVPLWHVPAAATHVPDTTAR